MPHPPHDDLCHQLHEYLQLLHPWLERRQEETNRLLALANEPHNHPHPSVSHIIVPETDPPPKPPNLGP